MTFPLWLQWIIGAGAVVGALAAIWTKGIKPLDKLIRDLHDQLELLAEMTAHHKLNPAMVEILAEIAAQFKSDSGSTLRDVVNRLETAATESKDAAKDLRVKAEVLEVGVAAVKALAVTDRQDAAHREVQLNEILTHVRRKEEPNR